MTEPDSESTPGALIAASVERTLELAATWLRWDGRPCVGEDPARVYTPNKVIRRTVDHLIDHLAHIEALVAGVPTVPDEWHASLVTFESDWARFTEVELDEARQRLRRLAQVYVIRLAALGPAEWDAPRGADWTIREIVEHVATPWYAEQVGDLSITAAGDPSR